ncbi:hypothetical protein SCA05_13450 [Staphylococcus carnosus]|nr:hypothetical protein SCA05_13450 [Staphylococcus carnosus]
MIISAVLFFSYVYIQYIHFRLFFLIENPYELFKISRHSIYMCVYCVYTIREEVK